MTELSVYTEQIKTFFSSLHREDLFEFTYAYTTVGERYFNRTLFAHYAGLTTTETAESLILKTREQLEKDRAFLYGLVEQLAWSPYRETAIHSKLLTYAADVWELIWRGVPFEVQKRYPEDDYTIYELSVAEAKVAALDAKLFGAWVCFQSREVSRSHFFLASTFSRYRTLLTDDEQARFSAYIDIVQALPARKDWLSHTFDEPSFLDEPFFVTQIPREIYIQMFAIVFQIYWLDIQIQQDERSSIYDHRDVLYVPLSEAYDSLSLRKVIRLIAHEIETHYVVLENTDLLLEGIKWGGNLFREEWLAIFQEFLLSGRPLSEVDMSDNMPLILMAELLAGEQYLDFLNLYRKMYGLTAEGKSRLLRSKRNYPLWSKWSQHKDVTYSRGLYQIREYIMQGKNFGELFLGKVDFTDLSLLGAHSTQSSSAIVMPQCIALKLVERFMTRFGRWSVYQHYIQLYPFIQPYLDRPLSTYQELLMQQIVESCGPLIDQSLQLSK
jgi:hypothetical protein